MVEAPGWPGIPARWTSSAKDGVGAALSQGSRVWFTISHGIVNEIYYPRVDQACVRDLGLIVTDGDAFFAEVKRDCETVVERIEDGVPAFRLTSTHRGGQFRMINRLVADPRSDSIVLHIRLEDSSKSGLRVFSLLAPHLVNAGAHNNGMRGEYKGYEILCAVGGGHASPAMLANPPFRATSVGFVGASDGWRQLRDHGRLTDPYDTATDGNVALSAELVNGRRPAPRFWRSVSAAPPRSRLSRADLEHEFLRDDLERLFGRLARLAIRLAHDGAARSWAKHL